MWLALFGVVVGYGLVVGVSVVVSGRPGASAVDSGGPVTTGLSWLVWTLGTVSLVLDVELVVYVDDVADDGANSTGSGGLDDLLAVWITAHTSRATAPARYSGGHYDRLLVVPGWARRPHRSRPDC